MTENNPPTGDDAFWDRRDDAASAPPGPPSDPAPDASSQERVVSAPPTDAAPPLQPTQPIPTWGAFPPPDAYPPGAFGSPDTWPQPGAPSWASQGSPYPPGQPYVPPQQPGTAPGQPAYPAQQPYPPQQPGFASQPGYPGAAYQPPAAKPRRTGVFILLGVLALCLVLVAGYLLLQPRITSAGPGTSGGPGGGVPAASASDAVQGYLQALVSGNASAALDYAATRPQDTTLLTDEVLAAGNAVAPISDIVVEPSTASGSAEVAARYTIGDNAVTDAVFRAVQTSSGWKLEKVTADLRVDSFPAFGTINGVEAPPERTITLFPGSYQIGTSDERYRASGTFVVESVTDDAGTLDVSATLSGTGVAAIRTAAQKHLASCVGQHKATPSDGCGFGVKLVERRTGKKITAKSIRWRITSGKDALKSLKPKVAAYNASIATGTTKIKLRVDITGTNGNRYWATSEIASVRAILGSTIEIRFNE